MDRKVAAPQAAPERSAVLTKSVINAARLLGLSQAQVAATLGVSEASASRMFSGRYVLEPGRGKEWELAALLVRLFRSLDSIVASEEKARVWLNSRNNALGARPVELLSRAEGLVSVLHYLDAARGRI
jgi:transcriptional regulator with XRE-family HTH domain